MHSYFISDLHLSPENPATVKAFLQFLQQEAVHAEKLYILGDLFEFWIGDDASEMLGAQAILTAMRIASEHTKCFFIAGNRDFLVRETFTELSGFTILPDETVIDLYGTPTLLLHGDSLCTEDVKHQQFRQQMMTNRAFCDQFLSLPIPERISQAKQARMQSHQHKSQVSMQIMDVSETSVQETFNQYGVSQMIHGHTHRQNTHSYDNDKTRYVLGDWGDNSSVLKASNEGIEISNRLIQQPL